MTRRLNITEIIVTFDETLKQVCRVTQEQQLHSQVTRTTYTLVIEIYFTGLVVSMLNNKTVHPKKYLQFALTHHFDPLARYKV